MPIYVYDILDDSGNPTGDQFEYSQSIKDEALSYHPKTNQPCRRAITVPNIAHNSPTWEWCEETRKYINRMKPKYISDKRSGVRKPFPKGGV